MIKWITLVLITGLYACLPAQKEKEKSDPLLERIAGQDYSEMIQLPLTSEGTVDSSKMAVIDFEYRNFDFDTIYEGDQVSHSFPYTNTGIRDLYILQTNSSCGCTVTDYSKDPIPPGASGSIQVRFNSKGKKSGCDHQCLPCRKDPYYERFCQRIKTD